MDASTCKEEGNAAMADADYVGAMKWYSQALTYNPKEAALYSNRSFAFLRLGLSERALADAEECVRKRPDWPKGHFRRAEALTQAGLHADALLSYERGAALDPSDQHLMAQCVEARVRDKAQAQREKVQVAIGSGLAVLIVVILLAISTSPPGWITCVCAIAGAAVVGAAGGVAFVLLRRQQMRGKVLPPLHSNDMFAALNMKGDRDGAGELRSSVLEQQHRQHTAQAPFTDPGGAQAGAGGTGVGGEATSGGGVKRRVKSQQAGRAAALKAFGKR